MGNNPKYKNRGEITPVWEGIGIEFYLGQFYLGLYLFVNNMINLPFGVPYLTATIHPNDDLNLSFEVRSVFGLHSVL